MSTNKTWLSRISQIQMYLIATVASIAIACGASLAKRAEQKELITDSGKVQRLNYWSGLGDFPFDTSY